MKNTDKVFAAVIGGGASGMVCALRAAQKHPDKRIVILERADRIGKKLMVTGNGRCNLTHLNASAESYHGDGSEALINILFKNYNTNTVLDFFSSIGLSVKADPEDRVYPLSNAAASVLDVLRAALSRAKVEVICDAVVSNIKPNNGQYVIITSSGAIYTDKLIIAVGGRADHAGRESSASDIIRMLKLHTVKTAPSLSPVKVNGNTIRSLKGVRTSARVSLIKNGEVIRSEDGELQFADGALSGICIFNLSRIANREQRCQISVALMPHMTAKELSDELSRRRDMYHDSKAGELFTGLFRRVISEALLKAASISISKCCSELTDNELTSLVKIINDWRFDTKTRGDFKNSQVTAGGVSLSEIDPHTFESVRHKNLYIIGEALDIDGDCGGYNLQFAWASGMCAGDSL